MAAGCLFFTLDILPPAPLGAIGAPSIMNVVGRKGKGRGEGQGEGVGKRRVRENAFFFGGFLFCSILPLESVKNQGAQLEL